MTNEIIIRKAVMSDMESLLRFEQGVIDAERPFDITMREDQIVYYDIDTLINAPHIEMLVAEMSSQLVGCGYVRIEDAKSHLKFKKFGYLGFMYVEPDFRGRGINRRIVEGLQNWCKAQKIMELRLDVYSKNLGAIRAYEKAGFSSHMLEMRMKLKEH